MYRLIRMLVLTLVRWALYRKWAILLSLCLPLTTSCSPSQGTTDLNIKLSPHKEIWLSGYTQLQTLKPLLEAVGIQLALEVDPTQAIFYQGRIPLDLVPNLIQSQTLHPVIIDGELWRVVDSSDSYWVWPSDPSQGPVKANRDEAVAEQLKLQEIRRAGQWQIDFCVSDLSVDLTTSTPYVAGQASAIIATTKTLGGSQFKLGTSITHYIQQFTVLQNTPALQSSTTVRQTGLILEGRVLPFDGKLRLQGSFESSTDLSADSKKATTSTIDILVIQNKWVNIAVIESASVQAVLKALKISLSGERFRLWVRVSSAAAN